MTALAEKQGELWCHLLALFSQSRQNQLHMVSKRHPTKVLSCMHLNMMSTKIRFQQYGWTVLANTIKTPTPAGGKVSCLIFVVINKISLPFFVFMQPVLSEPSLTLSLFLTESQLATNSSDLLLILAIVNFLAQVATAAKVSASGIRKEDQTYTEEQVLCYLGQVRLHLTLTQEVN